MNHSPRNRRRPALIGKALLALVSLAALFAAPSAASADTSYVGFQTHALWYERTDSEMDHELDMIQQLGGNVVRVDVGWSTLELNGKGQYDPGYVEKLDRFVNGADQRGIKVLATLDGTPCWASSAPESMKQGCRGSWWERGVENYPPTNPQDFADAANFITSRYGTKLAALELWNEPNSERFLVAPNRAAAYTAMVKAAYPAAKAGNSQVPVLAGALAAADRPFLDELYADGIAGSYDGISIHPYNEWRDPYDLWQPQWKQYTFLPGIEWIREAQAAAGDTTPIWVTEFGWDTCSGQQWCVSEAAQASYTVKAFQILDTLPYVQGAVDYELRDESSDKSNFEGNWGLVRQDFSPKPIFDAVREQLHGNVPSVGVTLEVSVTSGGSVVIEGKGTERQSVGVKISSCDDSGHLELMTSAKGRYRKNLGSVGRLSGCTVKAQPARSTKTTVKRIPGTGPSGEGIAAAVRLG